MILILPFIVLLLGALVGLSSWTNALTFTASQTSLHHNHSRTYAWGTTITTTTRTRHSSRRRTRHHHTTTASLLQMRDASCAYWFTAGDTVRVTSTVIKAGYDLKGRIGTVQQTWEKCDVDPTCCCAEFVDDNFAVTVQFEGTVNDNDNVNVDPSRTTGDGHGFTHFFNEDELIKVQEQGQGGDDDEELKGGDVDVDETTTSTTAFDGMSCTAFKLDQLKMGEQAQRISAYEASRSDPE